MTGSVLSDIAAAHAEHFEHMGGPFMAFPDGPPATADVMTTRAALTGDEVEAWLWNAYRKRLAVPEALVVALDPDE